MTDFVVGVGGGRNMKARKEIAWGVEARTRLITMPTWVGYPVLISDG